MNSVYFCGPYKESKAVSPSGRRRATRYLEARKLRQYLKPVRSQDEVAKAINMHRQSVEQIELSALQKIYNAFRPELKDLKLT